MRFPHCYGFHVLTSCKLRAKRPNSHSAQAAHFKAQMEAMSYIERLRPVRLWNQLSENGQRESGPMHGEMGMSQQQLAGSSFQLADIHVILCKRKTQHS